MDRRRLFVSSIRLFLRPRTTTRIPFQRVYTSKPKRPTKEEATRGSFAAGIVLGVVVTAITFITRDTESKTLSAPKYGSRQSLDTAIEELRSTLGKDAISTDEEDLHRHGYSEWSSYNIAQLPVAVAYPKSTAEVSQIAKCCTKHKIPMIPYSGGSSLEANYAAPHGGISIDMTYMDRIWDVREEDMDITVQPGVRWMELNEKIKHTGLFFPVDPGPTAMIGGMVATSCSGTNAFRYGTMRDWVINLTVVLPSGQIIKTKRRPRKSAAGYNLNHLFVGSEGTLGIITEVTLKLAPIPTHTSVAVATFPTLRAATTTAASIIRSGIPVAAMELMDEVSMHVVNAAGKTHKKWKEVPTLFFKFSSNDAAILGIQETQVLDLALHNSASTFESTKDAREQVALWSARKESLWSMLALAQDAEVWPTDVAVPISKLPEMFECGKQELDSLNLFASVLGHIGDGNFHETILFSPEEKEKVVEHVKRMTAKALELEGTSSGEHGIGMSKKDDLVDELGLETIDVMRQLKKSLDPLWIMNPGKVFDWTDLKKLEAEKEWQKEVDSARTPG